MLQTSSETVPGWFNFQRLYREVVDSTSNDNRSLFVELGFLFGKSTLFMGNEIKKSRKLIKFFSVDLFSIKNASQAFFDLNEKQKVCPVELTEHLCKVGSTDGHIGLAREIVSLSDSRDYIQIIPGKAQDLVHLFEDNSIDFLFIDTLHTYEDTLTMLKAFIPKVRKGGTLAGHDCLADRYPGLVQAVQEMIKDPFVVRETCFVWQK